MLDASMSAEPDLELPLLDIDVAAEKNIGGRTYDEDAVLVRSDLRLFAVADGAGGQNGGNLASSIAVAECCTSKAHWCASIAEPSAWSMM